MPVDPKSGLELPASVFEARHLEWLNAVTNELNRLKIRWRLEREEMGLVVTRQIRGKTTEHLVFNAVETQLMPALVFVQVIAQWEIGALRMDNVFRLLTAEEQERVKSRTGRQPAKTTKNAQEELSQELHKREDLRRQGFDPRKEGLT